MRPSRQRVNAARRSAHAEAFSAAGRRDMSGRSRCNESPRNSPAVRRLSAASRAGDTATAMTRARHAPEALRVLHLEDSELDHELALAHLQRGGLDVQALRIETEAEFLRRAGRPALGRDRCPTTTCPASPAWPRSTLLKAQRPGCMPVHPGLRRDRRRHRGRGDAQRRQRLPAEEQPGAAGAGGDARDRGARDARWRARAPTASWRRRAAPVRAGAAPADQRRDGARGDRARDPRRRRRLADGAEVRPRLDRAATPQSPEVQPRVQRRSRP